MDCKEKIIIEDGFFICPIHGSRVQWFCIECQKEQRIYRNIELSQFMLQARKRGFTIIFGVHTKYNSLDDLV